MKAEDLIQGLQIIEAARPKDSTPYHIRAGHEEIWAGSLEWDISEENKKKLEELGWTEDEECDGYSAYT